MLPVLYIGNRNYSSWSMRAWLVLRWGGLRFETRVIALGGEGFEKQRMPEVLAVSPCGTVPALHLGSDVVTDSLAICEWAAEHNRALWPRDPLARALARSAVCEMHSGFAAIRSTLPCNIRRRTQLQRPQPELAREIARVETLWSQLRGRFASGGSWLFGAVPTIADAFFTPVATRFRSYGVEIGPDARAYVGAVLADPAFREWESAALEETWTIPEVDTAQP